MTDPRTLTPSAVDQLTGRELAIAVEWFVFGDDLTARNDDRLYIAMRKFPEHELTFAECDIVGMHENAHPDRGWFLSIWDCRSQLSFCATLEAHASAWRAEPRELTAELALQALRTFGRYSLQVTGGCVNAWAKIVVYSDQLHDDSFGPDELTAVFRAAVKVAMQRHTTPPSAADCRR